MKLYSDLAWTSEYDLDSRVLFIQEFCLLSTESRQNKSIMYKTMWRRL